MQFSFKHILVPYDGTQSSKNAFQAALSIAKEHNSSLTVLTCLEEKSTFAFFQTKSDKKEYARIKKLAERHIKTLKAQAKENNVKFSSKITKSNLASDCIAHYAKENKITLIIMSKTKLTTKLEKRYYNSTVENVFRKNPCSLLIIT